MKVENTAEREAQLRARMLTMAKIREELHQAGYVPATLLATVRDDEAVPIDTDMHAERLINDLVEWGFLEEQRDQHAARVAREFRHRRFRITNKGRELCLEAIAPHPGIADRRLEA